MPTIPAFVNRGFIGRGPSSAPLLESVLVQDTSGNVDHRGLNVTNGIPSLDSNGDLPVTCIHRTGTAAELAVIVLKAGEVAFATDTRDILIGDGATAGGNVLVYGTRTTFSSAEASLVTIGGDIALTFSIVAGFSYRAYGWVGFRNDTDNQSNFRMTGGIFPGTALILPIVTRSGVMRCDWVYTNASTQTPDRQVYVATNSSASFQIEPPDSTKSTGICYFDYTFTCLTSGTFTINIGLRTAKIGTPTILEAHRVYFQRVP